LGAGKIDEPIFEEGRTSGDGSVDARFQNKAAHGLIDWHKLFSI
jgi:hypothetical protein